MVHVSEDKTDLRLSSSTCKDRFCVPCQTARAATFVRNVSERVSPKNCRFITLTLRASNTPLKDQLDRLFRSFLVFRRRNSFKTHCKGGAAFCEVKIGKKSGLWHPHLHILVEGLWWHQKDISKEWHAVTGDSTIVDIRAIGDSEGITHYVTKYVTKPADADVFEHADKLDELMCAIGGRRLATTFGTWRGLRLDADAPDATQWRPGCTVTHLRAEARQGNEDCIRILEAAARKWPLFGSMFAIPPPEDPILML